MRRLDRYVIREVLGPLGLGFLVYTSILLMQFLFQSAEMIIRRGLPVGDVGMLLVFTLPNIVVLTIPMAFLFGILVAVGRLASDSELIALRACGVSLFHLYRPVLLLSLLLTAATGVVMIDLLPWGNSSLQQLRVELVTKSVSQQVEPRVFYEEWQGVVLYVFDLAPGGKTWHGVFVADDLPGTENQVTVAERGRVRLDPSGERLILELENAVTHKVDFHNPDKYEISRHRHLEKVLEDQFTSGQRARATASKGIRELTLGELAARRDDPSAPPEIRRLAEVEIHKKFAIPVACLVFGLFALPLGFNNRRGSKSSGFAISIGVILVYYVLLNNGEEAARVGKVAPWLAMWLPNILLTGCGLLLLARRNRDKSLLLSRLNRWLRGPLFARARAWIQGREGRREERRAAAAATAQTVRRTDVLLRLPRPRLRFPNLLDRYIVRTFLRTFVVVLLSTMVLYVIADLSEIMDDILKNHVAWSVILTYYKFSSLQILYDVSPLVVLVTTLITFALLSRTNEVTAAKSLGLSLYRLALPALAAAAAVAFLAVVLEIWILPAANERVDQAKDRIRGRETARTYRRADRQWLFGQGRYIYNFLHYDPDREALQRLQVFEFDDQFRLVRRLFADSAGYAGDGWVLSGGWARSFSGLEVTTYTRFTQPRLVDYPETPDYFEEERKPAGEMSFRDLESYIRELKASGKAVPDLEVKLQRKIAFPVISLVMALVALPYAFRLGRRGALYGMGMAVVLAMIFLAVYAFFTTLGETGALPPILAAWAPNFLFTILAVYLFLGVRT